MGMFVGQTGLRRCEVPGCQEESARYSLPVQAVLCAKCEDEAIYGGPQERARRLRTRGRRPHIQR
jgi:hypothetical protein